MRKNIKTRILRAVAGMMIAAMLLTSCAGSTTKYRKRIELGWKYLSETNYTEAITAFTTAIRLNPDDIEAHLARAQAYAALEKYEEAAADYTTVIERTDDQPYKQVKAYVGRAGADENIDKLADAESDYSAALNLLGGEKIESSGASAEDILSLKKDVLVRHAAVCVALVLFEKASADYDALEKLGENVTDKRGELEDLIQNSPEEDTDAENGISAPDETDKTDAPEKDEAPADSKEEAASSKETVESKAEKEEAASSKEPAASSKEQPAQSKQEEQPASSQQTAKKETYQVQHLVWKEVSATVTYQVGTNTVWVKIVDTFDGMYLVTENTYTFSQPLTSVEHPSKGSTVFHLPAGTTVTCKSKYSGTDNAPAEAIQISLMWKAVSSSSAVQYDSDHTSTDLSYSDSLTIKNGVIYALANEDELGVFIDFPAIGFTAN